MTSLFINRRIRSSSIRAFVPVLVSLIVGWVSVQSSAYAAVFAPEITVADKQLVLNGEGPRKKAFITIYHAGLYLEKKSTDGAAIIQADQPMAMVLKMVSGLATAEKMAKAMRDGFAQSTNGETAPIAAEIDMMVNSILETGVAPDDIISNHYQPGLGTTVIINGETVAEISGLPFKQALFGIWLSQDPIQKKLKKQLLAN